MKAAQRNINLTETIKHWKYLSRDIHAPRHANDYDKLAKILDTLLDLVGEDESHQLIGLIDVISYMLTKYDEEKNYKLKSVSGVEALKFLMDQHQLKQTELPEIGSQGVVSEILQNKRKLNLTHIKKLSKRFNVSPETFID